jgi:hypothetical protein
MMLIYMGGVYGGSMSAILLNVPGAPASAATALDGHPLAQQGRAGQAIANVTISSFLGTLHALGRGERAAAPLGGPRRDAPAVLVEHALPRALRADAFGHVYEHVVTQAALGRVRLEKAPGLRAERGFFRGVVEVHLGRAAPARGPTLSRRSPPRPSPACSPTLSRDIVNRIHKYRAQP